MTLAIMMVTMLLRMVMDGDVEDDAEDGADDYDGAMMTTAMMMDGNMMLRMVLTTMILRFVGVRNNTCNAVPTASRSHEAPNALMSHSNSLALIPGA